MAEILFVLKVFFISCAFVFALQFKVGEASTEQRIYGLLQDSRATNWLKDVGQGAVRLTASTYKQATDPQVAQASVVEGETAKLKKAEEFEKKWVERVDKMVDGGAGASDYPADYAK